MIGQSAIFIDVGLIYLMQESRQIDLDGAGSRNCPIVGDLRAHAQS
jgi:hypothetical protein